MWLTWLNSYPLAVDVMGDGSLRWHLFRPEDREAEGPPLLSCPARPVLEDGWLAEVERAGGVTFLDGGPPVALSYEDCRALVGVLACAESVVMQLLDILRVTGAARAEALRVMGGSDEAISEDG